MNKHTIFLHAMHLKRTITILTVQNQGPRIIDCIPLNWTSNNGKYQYQLYDLSGQQWISLGAVQIKNIDLNERIGMC